VLLFFFVKVTDAGAVVHAGVGVDGAGFHEDMIDQSCLAGRAMSYERDVANVLDFLSHSDFLHNPQAAEINTPLAAAPSTLVFQSPSQRGPSGRSESGVETLEYAIRIAN
jgi:hypothetical protein